MEKTIDLDVILKNKMGDKAKWVPSPLVNWLKRVIHQDQVNAFLWESRELTGTPWLEACVKYLEMTLMAVLTVWRLVQSSAGTMTATSAIL